MGTSWTQFSSEAKINKPGGTVQKSTVYLGLEHLGLSFFTSLNHQLFKNIAYVRYLWHFPIYGIYLYLCIWESRISFLMSLDPWLFKNIAYVGYFGHFVICCICVFVYLRICICVFVYLTVQNIIFDVLGPLAFQKYSIIRVYKVFRAWWRTTTNEQPGEPRASPLVEQWTELTFAKINRRSVLFCTFPKFFWVRKNTQGDLKKFCGMHGRP